jgi:hypothetical protein
VPELRPTTLASRGWMTCPIGSPRSSYTSNTPGRSCDVRMTMAVPSVPGNSAAVLPHTGIDARERQRVACGGDRAKGGIFRLKISDFRLNCLFRPADGQQLIADG